MNAFNRRTVLILSAVLILLLCSLILSIIALTKGEPAVGQTTDSRYNVKEFGAKGDGKADDSQAIQTAIDEAEATGGGVVYVPAGKYQISKTLLIDGSNVEIRGDGKASVIFLNKSVDAVIKISNETGMGGAVHNRLESLTIDRSVAPDPDYERNLSFGVWVERARYTTLNNISVFNAGYGIAVGVRNGSGIPNQFTNITNSWVKVNDSIRGNSVIPGANVVFWSGADYRMTNVFLEPNNIGILLAENSNGVIMNGVTVINGGMYEYGVISAGSGFARYMSNFIIENAQQAQLWITDYSQRISLADSWIGAGDVVGLTRTGIVIDRDVTKVTISNNRIGDQRMQGILSSGSGVLIEGNTFEGNNNSGCKDCDAIQIMRGFNVTITDNMILNGGGGGIGLYDMVDSYIISNNNSSLALRNEAYGENKQVSGNILP